MIDARHLALKTLLSLNKDLYIQSALDSNLKKSHINEKDKGLCTELVYGYLRHEIKINYILGHFAKNIRNIPQEMIISLGIAVYSILFLSKIPDYASVNWAVEHVKNKFNLKLSKVANAVLRNIIRQQEEINNIKFYSSNILVNEFEAYALFYSMPLWIAKLWKDYLGENIAIKLMDKFSHRPKTGIRINSIHKDAQFLKKALLDAKGISLGRFGIMFESGEFPAVIAGVKVQQFFKDGICTLQSPGSMLVLDALNELEAANNCIQYPDGNSIKACEFVPQNDAIWDMCAGQGGKTTALLERGYRVKLATDVNFNRLKLLYANIKRLDLDQPAIVMVDKNHICIDNWKGTIVIDAPCSGLGILHRRPDIKRVKGQEDVLRYVHVQKELLSCAWNKLQSGGKVVYITCTINPLENQLQISNFLSAKPNAALLGQWHTDYDDFSCEGMYLAVIKKQ